MPLRLLYILSLLSLSTSANLVRLAEAPLEVIGFWRLLISALLIFPFAYKASDLKFHLNFPQKDLVTVLFSGLFFFAHLWTYFYAAQNTRIANCVIIFSVNPLFVALLSYLFLKERLSLRIFIAYIFAVLGLYQLFQHSLSFEVGFLWGDISALASAFFFAVYLVSGKKARLRVANSEYSFLAYLLTAILFGLTGSFQDLDFFNYSLLTWFAITMSVIFPTLLGHALFSYLIKSMNINLMSCGKLIEPVFSGILAFWLFGESLTNSAYLAYSLTSLALLILLLPWTHLLQKLQNLRRPSLK